MNKERVHAILNSRILHEVYYDNDPVWIQDVRDDIAKISFVNSDKEKDVYIEDLYEDNLYNE